MDNDTSSNPIDEGKQKPRIAKIALLGTGFMTVCIFFIAAFISFQPDQLSLSDRYFPSATPTPTTTPTPTPTPNLTATQQAIQFMPTVRAIQTEFTDPESQRNILLSDTFDNNNNHWYEGIDDGSVAKTVYKVINGKYHWEAVAHEAFTGSVNINTQPVTDFYLSVEVEQLNNDLPAQYGLLFRKVVGKSYYFGIEDGAFIVRLEYEHGFFEDIDLIDWTKAPSLRTNGKNRLAVIAKGSHFIFLINDQYVAYVNDDRLPSGTTAFMISLHKENQQAVLEFDNFELRTPK